MSLKTIYNDFYGDQTRWWVGVVESVDDPAEQGRLRVRIYGVHSASVDDIPNEDLPWAQVLAPITHGGTSGLNGTPVGIQAYAQVFGIFLDGKHSQLPLVLGSIPKVEGIKPDMTGIMQAPPGSRGYITPTPGTPGGSYNNIPMVGGGNIEQGFNFLEQVFRSDFFLSNSKELAAGFIGNFISESGVNPAIVNQGVGGAYGIAQWRGARLRGLIQYGMSQASSIIKSSDGRYDLPDLKGQLSYVIRELQSERWIRFSEWSSKSTTAALAANYVEAYYEISEISSGTWKTVDGKKTLWKFAPYQERYNAHPELVKRIQHAEEVFKTYSVVAAAPRPPSTTTTGVQ
tara:strand:- start:214 stop:1245 length:1032 start_codon:yes stop_codon:yes gene_type:complete